jgi:hypothetical protein
LSKPAAQSQQSSDPRENENGKKNVERAVIEHQEPGQQEFLAAQIRRIFQQFPQTEEHRCGDVIAKALVADRDGLPVARSVQFLRRSLEPFVAHPCLRLFEARFATQVWTKGAKGSCNRDATPEER